MYSRLPYVFRGVLPLKTLVLYIYTPVERHNVIQPTTNNYTQSILHI
jgi:hypothetical protein